jgi:hypothetical protein
MKVILTIFAAILLGVLGVFFLPFLSIGCVVADSSVISNFVTVLFEKIS